MAEHTWVTGVLILLIAVILAELKLPILEESNLMQMYGSFDGFLFNSALFGLVI